MFYKEAVSLAKYYQVELHAVGVSDGESHGGVVKNRETGTTELRQVPNNDGTQGVAVFCLPRQKSRLARISNTLRLIRRAVRCRPDIVHFHDPELIFAALFIKLITRCKVIYDVHEDFPAAILSKFWIPKELRKPLSRLADIIEKKSCHFFDLLILAEASYQEKFLRVKTRKVDIYNYPLKFAQGNSLRNAEAFPSESPPALQEKLNLVYAGSLTKTRGAMTMLQGLAQADLGEKSFHLWILGPVRPDPLQQEMQDYIDNNPRLRNNVTFLGIVPLETVFQYCRCADLGLALLHPEPNYLHSLATKLFDYMAAGLPILASNFPLWVKLLEETQSGLTVDPTDPLAIASALEYLLANHEVRAQMSQYGLRACTAQYNWAHEEQKLLEAYRQVLEQ